MRHIKDGLIFAFGTIGVIIAIGIVLYAGVWISAGLAWAVERLPMP